MIPIPPRLTPAIALTLAALLSVSGPGQGQQPEDVPDPQPPKSKIDQKKPVRSGDTMTIRHQDYATYHSKTRTAEFAGDVEVDARDFDLWCDLLKAEMMPGDSGSTGQGQLKGVKTAVATGAQVRIQRQNNKGELETATARKAEFDSAGQTLVLTGGPPQIQTTSGAMIDAGSPDARIILDLATGSHTIIGPGKTEAPAAGKAGGKDKKEIQTITIPVSNSDAKDPSLPANSLESLQNQR